MVLKHQISLQSEEEEREEKKRGSLSSTEQCHTSFFLSFFLFPSFWFKKKINKITPDVILWLTGLKAPTN